MRRAISSLASLSSFPKPKLFSRPLLTGLFTHLPPPNPSPLSPPPFINPLLPFSFLSQFPRCPPSRRIQTLPFNPPPQPVATAQEVFAAFESLESTIDNDQLGLAEHLDLLGSQDLEKALDFSLRALQFFEKRDGGWSLTVAKVLHLMGSISCKMKRFDDSVESLDTAAQILDALYRENSANTDVLTVSIAVQLQLASTKTEMGRRWPALINLQNSLELKGLILEHNSKEMGDAYKGLAEAYVVSLDYDKALPLAFRALDIYSGQFGENSRDVVQIRRLLVVIYTGLEQNEEALEQNELSRRVLESLCVDEELFRLEIDAANIQIELGRFEQAINTLKRVIKQTDKGSEMRALVLISMAKAFCSQENFGDCRRCLEIACSILDKMEIMSPPMVAEAYADISMIFETMNDFEIALTLMKRTLAILQDLPQSRHLEGSISARLGWLLLFTKRVPQSVPYLESAVEKLKDCFGPKHYGLGFVYKHLGKAYLDMDEPQSAVKMFVLAKEIIDKSFGLQHEDSIDTYQCIADAYGNMGRYDLAIEYQKHVLDAWENHGPSAYDEYRESLRLLEQLKKKLQGSRAAVFPANSLPQFLQERDVSN